jgi:hypothetical protein
MHATRWRTAALVAAALLAGSIIGPPLAQAASVGIVTIEGSGSTNRAAVSGAGQVYTAPTDPGKAVTVFSFTGSGTPAPGCAAGGIYTIPAGQALIVTGVDFYNFATTAGTSNQIVLEAGPVATPCTNILAGGVAPGSEDGVSQNQEFSPGIAVPAGDALGLNATNESGSAEFYGYLVPAADVPPGALSHISRAASGLRTRGRR